MTPYSRYRLLLAGLWLFAACGGPDERADETGDVETTPLAAEVLYSSDSLGIPHLLAIAGENLLVTDIGGGASLHVLNQGRRVASFGREGRGPGEFSGIRTLQPSADGRTVWLYDLGNTRLTLLDLDSVAAGRRAVRETVVLRSDLGPMNAVRLSDSLIVTSGLFTRGQTNATYTIRVNNVGTARTTDPRSSSGAATTAASASAGCATSALSTSNGPMR